MAITTTTFKPTLSAVLRNFIDGFNARSAAYIERHSRRAEIEALQAKSDAELARMGLTRDRIVHHVFSDRIWF